MHTIKVTFASGNVIVTNINGSEAEIRRYYAIGSIIGFDNQDKIVNVEFIR